VLAGAVGLLICICLPAGAARAVGPTGGLDSRGWELVSPIDKNGGDVAAPETEGGAIVAAASGGALAYASSASFGEAIGAPPLNQYVAFRGAGAWATSNISPPILSGTHASGAYQLFSPDLARSVLSNGWSCQDGSPPCPAENPPLAAGAPAGYRNLYLREGSTYVPVLTTTNAPSLSVSAEDFQLALAGSAPDLAHLIVSTCAALTADAEEVPTVGGGCESTQQNLYEWSGGNLVAVNVLPGDSTTTPGAVLASPSGAVSDDGKRVYFRELSDGALYLHETGAQTVLLPETAAAAPAFQAASEDGRYAFFTKGGHLYRYDANTKSNTDLTPGGGVQGTLAVSTAGDYAYFQDGSALRVWHNGATGQVAAGASVASSTNYPPATGTARLNADGTKLVFLSAVNPTNYKNVGTTQEVYRYDAVADQLLCLSCNYNQAKPLGASSLPGAYSAAEGPAAYRPRALSTDGSRVFFDSQDRLVSVDTNKAPDVYEWEAQGSGACVNAGGCVGLISVGRAGSARFLDASSDGTDVYFLTPTSLLALDPGAVDVYDARAGGGYPEPPPVLPCEGDDCQGPPNAPDDPIPGTATFEGPPNPPVHYPKVHKKHHKKKKKKMHSKRKKGHGRKKGGSRR
jgi:hypothetical protein